MKSRISNSMLKKMVNKKMFNNNLINNKLINNRITLFFVAALAFISLYIHIVNSNFSAVLLFFLTCGLVYCFTKNMTLVLGASFIVTTIAYMTANLFGFREGLAGKEPAEPSEEEIQDKIDKALKKNKVDTDDTENAEDTEDAEDAEDNTPKKKKAAFNNQKLSPALFNTPSKKDVEQQLGKATEAEQAYDNLEKIMGTEKINSISSETKDLIKQQNELIKQLKSMTPALNNAMASLGGLDLNKLTGMFNSATKNLSEIKDE